MAGRGVAVLRGAATSSGIAASWRRRASVLVAAVGVVALLSGCDGEQVPQPTTASSSAVPAETAGPTTAAETVSFRDALGREFVVASPAQAEVDSENERITVRAAFETPKDALLLTAPDSAAWEVQSDSSVLLRDEGAVSPDGAPAFGGTVTPQSRDVNNSSVRVEVTTGNSGADDGHSGDGDTTDDVAPEHTLKFRLQPRGITEFPVELEVSFAPQALDRVEWAGDLEGGRSLQVFPTAWGRSGSEAASSAVWQSIIAREPEADTDVMDKQLRCHALGAPDKTRWNLEPWRPDVPYLDYLIARCNPN